MKILLYNYVQLNEKNNPGGGVTVYLRNLASTLRSKGHRIYTLSSGDRYTRPRGAPRLIRPTESEFIILNSPVVAPAIYSFHNPEFYLRDRSIDEFPEKLLRELGNIDIIHFHNIEGLTFSFFQMLRASFPSTPILFSAHNYSIICPQVNLWKRNSTPCHDFDNGFDCTTCVSTKYSRSKKIFVNVLKSPIKKLIDPNRRTSNLIYSLDRILYASKNPSKANGKDLESNKSPASPEKFGEYRAAGVDLINYVFDKTIAVSSRTKEILENVGADPTKIRTLYIGTRHIERMANFSRKRATSSGLHICYMGYMRADKGFFHFLEALENLPDSSASCMDVTVAAKFTDADAVSRVLRIQNRFRTFRTFDGYTHDQLESILSPVNLGIVPPLWEDNLPQVAIEFVTHGIPILTSDMGGAQEIANNSDFMFSTDSPTALRDKLVQFITGELDSADFWANELTLRTNEQHVQEILDAYESEIFSRLQATSPPGTESIS